MLSVQYSYFYKPIFTVFPPHPPLYDSNWKHTNLTDLLFEFLLKLLNLNKECSKSNVLPRKLILWFITQKIIQKWVVFVCFNWIYF